MATYRGKLDGLMRGQLIGWVVNVGDMDDRPNVMVLVGGRVVAVARADLIRQDLLAQGFGDGAHGFKIDLAPYLDGSQKETEIDVLVGPTGWALPGSPLRYVVPARGYIDHWRNDELCGWAHGEACGRTRLEVLRDGKFLAAWPCDQYREDLARLKIGDGRFGFTVPIGRLCGGDFKNLSFRIEGTTVLLDAPRPEHGSPGAVPGVLAEPRFANASEARRALLDVLEQPVDRQAANRHGVRLSFAALQNLLNELSFFENRLHDEQRRVALLADAGKPGSAAPLKPQKSAAGTKLLSTFDRLVEDVASLDVSELKTRIERDIVPLYARDRKSRVALEDKISGCQNLKLLESIVAAFRAHDFLKLPALAYRSSLQANPLAGSRNALALRLMESWANCHNFRNIPTRRQAHRALGKPRALYVFWSCLPYDANGYCIRSHYLLRALGQIGEPTAGLTRLGFPWDSNQGASAAADMVETFDNVVYFHLGGPQANRRLIPLESYIEECADRIAHVATMVGADVIHSASNWMVGLPALIAARRIGRPFCYEMRGLWEVTRASNRPGYELSDHYELFSIMEALTAGEADLVLTITPQVRDDLARRGVNPARMRPAPNGVDTERFKPIPKDHELKTRLGIKDEFVFGFVGSFAEYEGLIDACRAAIQLRDRHLPFKLLLVGDGAVYDQVKAFCAQHDLLGSVILTGRVPFTDAPRYYSLIDVALCPRIPVAITEIVAPLKPFEAMAMGKPVIGSDVAPIAEIIKDGQTGWLFRKGDVSALAALMMSLVKDRNRLPEVGVAARDFVVRTHDWKMIAGGIAAAWRELRRPNTLGKISRNG